MGNSRNLSEEKRVLSLYPLSHMDFLALSIPVACLLWLALHLRLGHFPHEVFQHLGSYGVTYGYLNDIAPEALSIPIIMFFGQVVMYAKMYHGLINQKAKSFIEKAFIGNPIGNESFHVKFYQFINRYFIPIHVILFSFCIPISNNYSHFLLVTFLGLVIVFYTAFRFAYTALFKKYISAQEVG